MKLPHSLLRTYRKYKEQERILLLWIEKTAAASGYVPQTGNDKLKGRARTLARRATAAQRSSNGKAPPTPDASLEEPTISILEILAPVRFIARNTKIASIPTHIAEHFTAIYGLRKACLDWFKFNTNQSDAETCKRNEKHAFPLKITRDAIELLRSKDATKKTTPSGQEPSTGVDACTSKAANNTFGYLSLEETDDIDCPSTYIESEHSKVPPSKSSRISQLTRDEAVQDEVNMAKFCMLRNIQQIEDFMVLELVRYSFDQANADILPFLSNLAIDIVAKMESLLHASFDWEKFETGFLNTIVVPNEQVIWSSPLLRMQNAISTQVKKKQGVTELKMFDTVGFTFDPRWPYFGAHAEAQMFLEQLFVEELFRI